MIAQLMQLPSLVTAVIEASCRVGKRRGDGSQNLFCWGTTLHQNLAYVSDISNVNKNVSYRKQIALVGVVDPVKIS